MRSIRGTNGELSELTEGLNAGDYIATTEHLTIDLYCGVPGGEGEFAEQTQVVATVNSQPLGNRKDELPMRNRGTDGLGDRLAGQQGAFLVAAWIEAALLAGEFDEHPSLHTSPKNAPKQGKSAAKQLSELASVDATERTHVSVAATS